MLKFVELFTLVALASAAVSRTPGPVIGGGNTRVESIPYQASVRSGGSLICGASIIGEYWVLTSCDCLEGNLSSLTVVAGTTYASKGGSKHSVEAIVCQQRMEPDTPDTTTSTLALIRVKERFIFDNTRQPIKMFNQDEKIPTGAIAVISGWSDPEDEDPVDVLRSANVPIIPKDVCNDIYDEEGGITAQSICVAYPKNGTCIDDTAGSLVVGSRLAGIYSWNLGCDDLEYPGVYLEVAASRDWIKAITRL